MYIYIYVHIYTYIDIWGGGLGVSVRPGGGRDGRALPPFVGRPGFISQQVRIKLFCKSQFPHESINFTFIITSIKNQSMDLCGK